MTDAPAADGSNLAWRYLGGGTIGGLIEARAAESPDRTCISFLANKVSLTYRDLERETRAIAFAYLSHGLGKGDRVALMLPNTPEHLLAWLAANRAGLTVVPINNAYKGDILSYILGHSGCKAIVISDMFTERLLSAVDDLEALDLVVVAEAGERRLGSVPGRSMESWHAFQSVGCRTEPSTPLPLVEPTDTCGVLYTSGTTGRSKGVVVPHLHNLVMAAEASNALGITGRDVLFTCLPMFHGNATIATILNGIHSGASVAISERFSVTRFWDQVRDSGATEFNALGSMLYMLLTQPESERDRDHAVRLAFAAPAPADVLHRFENRFGVTLIEGYGQTEIKNVAYNPLGARRVGSFGKPTPTSTLAILDSKDHEVRPGTVGEISYRPRRPNIMLTEYWRDPEATASAMRNLWWHTGDLGYMDLDGYFYFVDRISDSLRRRGENISSYEVEAAVLRHKDITDAAAIAMRSDVGEDEVMVVAVRRPDSLLEPAELFRHCDGELPYFMVPRYYRFVDDLPRTANGKIQKGVLRAEGIDSGSWDALEHGLKPTR